MKIKIEKNIVKPKTKNKWVSLYRAMNVGDSFVIPVRQRGPAVNGARQIGLKVVTKLIEAKSDNVRVWLVGSL